jgi:hypothetical protein
MFGKKKKEKEVINEVFGKMLFFLRTSWNSFKSCKINLWEKEYILNVKCVDKYKENINSDQEQAYIKFKENIEECQKRIEKIVALYYETEDKDILISKFTPSVLVFSRDGECILYAENADDIIEHDPLPGLAVNIFPKLEMYTGEEYDMYLYGGGALYDPLIEIKDMDL